MLLICFAFLSGCASKKEKIKITDYENSLQTLKLSCQQNFKESCTALGLIAHSRTEVSEAENYFIKACDLKDAFACRELALLKQKVSGNILSSKAELFRACKAGLKDACQKLRVAVFFDKNISGLYEETEAKCKKNDFGACHQLAAGLSTYQDFSEAKKYFEKACDNNSDESCYMLAHQEYQFMNFEKSLLLYKKLCEKKFRDSCLQLERGRSEGLK